MLMLLFIPDNCNTAPYTKSDGSYVCGFVLPSQLPFLQASIQCGQMGGRLPEVKSAFDNQYLQILFNVIFFFILIVLHFQNISLLNFLNNNDDIIIIIAF